MACVSLGLLAACGDDDATTLINDDRTLTIVPQHQELLVGDTGRVVAGVIGVDEPVWIFTPEDTSVVRAEPTDYHVAAVIAKAPGMTRIRAHVASDTTLAGQVSVTVLEH